MRSHQLFRTIFFLGFSLFCTGYALGQTANHVSYIPINDQSLGSVTNPNIDQSKEVGSIVYDEFVGSNGEYNLKVEIDLPFGTNNMEPLVSLVYNSNIENGHLGRGWKNAAVSFIERRGSDLFSDGQQTGTSLSSSDQYFFDGQRLVTSSLAKGAPQTVYQTQIQSFQRITSKNGQSGPESFIVETKKGVTYYYGLSQNSRFKGNSTNGAMVRWYLEKAEDLHGNYISYTYDFGDNDPKLARIEYTGNSKNNIAPYNKVEFNYEIRSDRWKEFVGDASTTDFASINYDNLLTSIEVSNSEVTFDTYNLEYGYEKGSYLLRISRTSGNGEELNPLVFDYKFANYQWPSPTVTNYDFPPGYDHLDPDNRCNPFPTLPRPKVLNESYHFLPGLINFSC